MCMYIDVHIYIQFVADNLAKVCLFQVHWLKTFEKALQFNS